MVDRTFGRYIIKEVTLGAGPLTQSPVNIKLSPSFDNLTDPWRGVFHRA